MTEPKPSKPRISKELKKALDAYRELLSTHDWHYEYSNDPSRYARGRAQRDSLDVMKKYIDPDGTIWKQYEKR